MKLLQAIIDWFNRPIQYQYESELDYLNESVDAADLEKRLKDVSRKDVGRVQRYRTNVALKGGYL
jgi:hypothetical protein